MYLPEVREIVAYNTVSYVLISVKVKGQSKAIPYGQRARARARGKDSQLEETSPARRIRNFSTLTVQRPPAWAEADY